MSEKERTYPYQGNLPARQPRYRLVVDLVLRPWLLLLLGLLFVVCVCVFVCGCDRWKDIGEWKY